jgi:2-polyprenyl-3-methyl-5-hydroxy-6-metoxy-1,4-benzoquinol methylase
VDARTKPKLHLSLQPQWDSRWSVRDRFDAVKNLIQGTSVLDIGSASRHLRSDWLHGLIAEQCSDVVGIDIDAKAVEAVTARGYDIRVADAREFDLGRKFEVVFAGEVIEHIDNPGGFLRSVRRHLVPDGRLVLTTPNAFYVANSLYRLAGHAHVHPEHTCWYCETTIRRLLDMNGFDRVEVSYTGHSTPNKARAAAGKVARAVLPQRLSMDTLVVVARPGI